jgi:mono/diheme cytochrome c family protein
VPVTPAVVRAGAAQHHNERTLREGRALFVSRCIECHTLPAVQKYTAAAWPHLVDKMAKRADLKPTERDAIVAYVLAARSQ